MTNQSNDVILRNGRLVMREFYNAVRFQVEDAIAELRPGKKYTAKALCGEAFWTLLGTPGLRQQAGRCLAHLVSVGGIRLAFAPSKRKSKRFYCLPSSDAAAPKLRVLAFLGQVPTT